MHSVIRLSRITIAVRNDTSDSVYTLFYKLNGMTFARQGSTTQMNISPNVNNISTDNILAYRPNYNDRHGSNIATLFVNLEALYPCVTSYAHASCKLFPSEDDGFHGGKAIFEASDGGGNFQIFGGKNTMTYAFAVEECTQLTSSCTNIPPGFHMDFTLVCLLPSSRCTAA